tara:strand:- start:37 stop:306 length:270 start_codon:yes stop_codon:yes gene_type:complete
MNDYEMPKYFLVRTYYVKDLQTNEFSNVEVYDTYDGYRNISEVIAKYRSTLNDDGLFESYVCKVLEPSKLRLSFWLEKIKSLFVRRRVI